MNPMNLVESMELDPFATVFFDVDVELEEHRGYKRALEYLAARMNIKRYHTIVDLLFCELFGTPWPDRCIKFYREEGPPLGDNLSEEQIDKYQRIMLRATAMAVVSYSYKRHIPWSRFRSEVLRACAQNGLSIPKPKWPTKQRRGPTKATNAPTSLLGAVSSSCKDPCATLITVPTSPIASQIKPVRTKHKLGTAGKGKRPARRRRGMGFR